MSSIQNPRISMFILMQNDLDKAIEFYTNLGFSLNFHIPQQWAEFSTENIKLGLAYTDIDLPERRTGIVLEVDDLKSWCNQVVERGITCSEPVEQVHGVMSSITDPGNNILELYQPTPEKMEEAIKKHEEKK
ncbi:MAG: VOC family protein [Candidatus Babeliales bacterium]